MVLPALFGAISDYYTDSTDFVQKTLDVYDKRTIYLEAGLLSQALRTGGKRNYSFKRKIMKGLSRGEMPSANQDIVNKAIEGTRKEWETIVFVGKAVMDVDGLAMVSDVPRDVSPTKAAKFALGITGRPVAIATRKHKTFIDVSARKRSTFSLDLTITFRTIATRFGGSGGGHPSAAGARIPEKFFNEFLEALQKEVEAIP